jgi:hypothetical protein
MATIDVPSAFTDDGSGLPYKEATMSSRSIPAVTPTLVLAAVLMTGPGAAHAAADMLVGVLEDAPAATTAERAKPRVRVVFRHTAAAGWEPFPDDCLSDECLARITSKYPSRTTWAVSLAGLTVGTVTGRTPATFHTGPQIGLQDTVSKGAMPFVGRPSIEYAVAVNEPLHRPLLATSGRRKPQRSQAGWKQGAPEPEDLERVWPAFRRLIPLIDNCQPPTDADADASAPPDTGMKPAGATAPITERHPRKLELEIPVAWVARNGDALLKVNVREEVFRECDGPRAHPSQLWMYRDARGRVWPLPGQLSADRADLVTPLEFADLLRDGHDELLFLAAGHERGGYVLYFDSFRNSVKYTWPYR